MKSSRNWVAAGVALSIVGVIAGCGTTNNRTTPATNVTTGATNTAATQNSPTTNDTTMTSANHTVSNQTTQNATGTNTSSNSPFITLESVQVATKNSIILVTTHGTMRTAYQNPKITNGVFTVTLVNMNLPQSISANKTYTSNGISYSLVQHGSNLILTARFGSNTPTTFKTGIGGGDMINFIFQ